jgi:cellulose biosynthesis protein BcsQ
MSKLGIIAPSNLVQFFKQLGVEVIESQTGERESAVAITNAVSAAPGSAPRFPILIHGAVEFMGASAWLRAMTTTRGYTALILGGDPEQFKNAGEASHLALPASMQDVFVALGPEFAGIAANNRFGNLVVGEDYGITDATAAVAEAPAPQQESVYADLPEDLIPAPVSTETTSAPTWAQAAPSPAQQPAPVPVVPVAPVDADVPAWAQAAVPAPAPAPAAAPTVPAPALAPETGAGDDTPAEPLPVLTPEAYEATFEEEAPVAAPQPAPVQEWTQAAPPVGEPVYRPEQVSTPAPTGAPLTRREAAALAAAQAAATSAPVQEDAPAWATDPTPTPAPQPAFTPEPVAQPAFTPAPTPQPEPEAPAAQVPFVQTPAVQPFVAPALAPAPAPTTPERKLTVFDPYSGGTSTAPVHTYEQNPAPAAQPAPTPAPEPTFAPEPTPSIPVFNPASPPSAHQPLPVPVMPRPEADYALPAQQAPAYVEPPAYTAPRMEPVPSTFAGPRAKIVASFAGKGGVTKTTTALIMAKKAADARLRTVVIDMDKGQDNVAAYMRLRSASLPTIFDAVAAGRPEAALITPDQYGKFRHEAAGRLDFAVVFGPGNEHASNHPSLTSDVYRQVIDFAAANADLVILDTQILKADRSASKLFYDVVAPLLVEEAYGVGITDQSRAGLEDLENRLKELQKNEGLTRDRMLIMAANTTGFNQTQAESFARRFRTYGDFIGATSSDDAFKAQLNVGRIDADSPAVSATMDAILHKVTGNDVFAPKPVKKRRGLFGRG